ncbi:MAG: hypothetical protein HKN22_06850 [Bacteroidia bacterium]|nr:hypothetical protein [Bacteroidia bacterium]
MKRNFNKSIVSIQVDLSFYTYKKQNYFNSALQEALINHLNTSASENYISMYNLTVTNNYVACKIDLHNCQSIAKVARILKGESSRWINLEKVTAKKFKWQDGYFASSLQTFIRKSPHNIINKHPHAN